MSQHSDDKHEHYQRAADLGIDARDETERREIQAYRVVAEAVRQAPIAEPSAQFASLTAARCADFDESAGMERWLLRLMLPLAALTFLVSLSWLIESIPQRSLSPLLEQAPWPLLLTAALVAAIIRVVEAQPTWRVSRPPG